jgi:hypothetical protein
MSEFNVMRSISLVLIGLFWIGVAQSGEVFFYRSSTLDQSEQTLWSLVGIALVLWGILELVIKLIKKFTK